MINYKKVFENKDYLVIIKPAGLLVHGAPHIKEPTLADQLLKKYPDLVKVGEDPDRPGIVHRLDKEASGLMVIPKTQDAFDNLKKQFQTRTVNKKYTALVYGKIEKDEDEINFPITRSSKGFKMAAKPFTTKGEINEDGRQAITGLEVKQRFINYTLLKVKTKTGRTHQVRVHLLAYGHSIVGDNLYSTKKTREKNKKINLGRIFLVADELSFVDMKGEKQEFKAGLPEELKSFLRQIK